MLLLLLIGLFLVVSEVIVLWTQVSYQVVFVIVDLR